MPTPAASPYLPPLHYRLLLRLAACLVPRSARTSWQARQNARLFHWWILAERGELPRRGPESAALLRGTFQDALQQRISPAAVTGMIRGPLFYLLTAACLFTLLAASTRCFAYTRHLVELALLLLPGPPGLRSDVLAGHAFILAISLTAAAAMLLIRRPSAHSGGWRYWTFFALQCALVLTFVPLVWIESGAALRACFPHHEGLRALSTLLLTLAYLPSLAAALAWVLADQRARCPVCLRRLELPVSVGSWSSVFDPSATEFLCDRGHGALLLPDSSAGAERWTRLDQSWAGLFSHSSG